MTTNIILKGDIHDTIKHIPDDSINMIYTDPPFATPKINGINLYGGKNYLSRCGVY